MAQPLPNIEPAPQNVRFSHFGVLNDGSRSKSAAVSSITVNVVIALVVLILGAVAKTNPNVARKLTELTLPNEPPKVTPAPKPPPPPKLPPPPKIETPKIEPPKIKMPEPIKAPELKPIEVPQPKPMVTAPAPPKIMNPAPAPKAVSLANAQAASVPNHDAHPTAVRLGQPDNPLKPLTGPAVSRVNMGNAGMPGMNAGNTGNGPRATRVNLGNGNPNGTDINGNGTGRPVAGVKMGCIGCTGPLNSTNYSNAPKQVQLQVAQAAPPARQPEVHTAPTVATPPKVTYKPTPAYTAEARSLHLEGNVSVRIRVTASGAVEVLSVTRGLGHGLDQAAVQAIQGTRFQPAKDATGRPIDWEGVVNVNFQLS